MANPLQLQTEFCVVGAGYAGLTAALRLQQAGRSVIVLEARDRIGGRVWSDKGRDKKTIIDVGGHWVGPPQKRILNLADELGIRTYSSPHEGEVILVQARSVHKFKPFMSDNKVAALKLVEKLLLLDAMAAQLSLDAPWDAQQAADWDSQTVACWMAKISQQLTPGEQKLPPEQQQAALQQNQLACDLLAVMLNVTGTGAALQDQSLLWLLYLIRTAGNVNSMLGLDPGSLAQGDKGGGQDDAAVSLDDKAGGYEGGAQDKGIEGGAQAVADKMSALLGTGVHLNCPVHRINQTASNGNIAENVQDATGVEVISDNVVVRAQRVIVAMPPTLTGFIRFAPQLPPDRAQLIQRMPMGSIIKATLCYAKPFWREDNLSGQSMALDSPVSATADGGLEPGPTAPGLLIAFVAADHARKLGRMNKSDRQQLIINEVAARFNTTVAPKFAPHVGTPDEYKDHNWSEEEWTRGDYAAFLPPGVLTGYGPALRQPFGRVHWAGTETATQWSGYIDGAVQSGERAARELAYFLSSGDKIALQAHDNKYWYFEARQTSLQVRLRQRSSVIRRLPEDYLFPFHFTVKVLESGKIQLIAFDGRTLKLHVGHQISWLTSILPAHASRYPEVQFTLRSPREGVITLVANNGKFLHSDFIQNTGDIILVSKDEPDETCEFRVKKVE